MAKKSRKKSREEANKSQEKKKVWRCAAYNRLSNEDHAGPVSNSIESQSMINRAFIEQNPELIFVKEFSDDGKSGTTFNRNGFHDMLEEATVGNINCIVVKDLSRLGRNYIDTEDYITKIFPLLGIRFISVNDQFDTNDPACDEKILDMRIKNLTNDFYAKQVSQNVGQAFENLAEEGIYHGPVPPYGYLIDNSIPSKRHLVIEKEYGAIARNIFEQFLDGRSLYGITKFLNDSHIRPPMRHFTDLGYYKSRAHAGENTWYKSTVKAILENPAYCGCLAVCRHKQSFYKGIPKQKIPKDRWVLIPDTHEAIISREEYETVQRYLSDRAQSQKKKMEDCALPRKMNPYAGKIRCGTCQKPLIRDYFRKRTEGRTYYQCCAGYKYKETDTACKNCYINENKLEQKILAVLHPYIAVFLEKSELLEELTGQKEFIEGQEQWKKQSEEIDTKCRRIIARKKGLYSDLKQGIIEEEEYLYAKQQYSEELLQLQEKMAGIESARERKEAVLENTAKWRKRLEGNAEIVTLTKELAEELIREITVFSSDDIKVQFAFEDIFTELDALIGQRVEG